MSNGNRKVPREQFREEVQIGMECVAIDGLVNAENLAKSYGL